MPTYFFDTSVLIAYFEREYARCVRLIDDLLGGRATAAISLLTVAELWAAPDMTDASTERERVALTTLMEVIRLCRRWLPSTSKTCVVAWINSSRTARTL